MNFQEAIHKLRDKKPVKAILAYKEKMSLARKEMYLFNLSKKEISENGYDEMPDDNVVSCMLDEVINYENKYGDKYLMVEYKKNFKPEFAGIFIRSSVFKINPLPSLVYVVMEEIEKLPKERRKGSLKNYGIALELARLQKIAKNIENGKLEESLD